MQNILVTFLYQILNYLQEVETSEKNAFTKRIDGAKNKITKARSDLRVRVRSIQIQKRSFLIPLFTGWLARSPIRGEVSLQRVAARTKR